MSLHELPMAPGGPPPELAASSDEQPFARLVRDAARQLTICNACRYCEGLCAVFPALARRSVIEEGDITQLANVCHDCRACYDACMYSAPHQFDLDLPRALSAVRLEDYRRHVWPRRVPRLLAGRLGVLVSFVGAAIIMLVVAITHAGWSGLAQSDGSPASVYRLVPYPALLALMLTATAYAVAVMIAASRSYWRSVGNLPGGRRSGALAAAVWQAVTLRYLRGGGQECYYPDNEQPSRARRDLHSALGLGFVLCIVSTVAAAISQDILGSAPPYPWLSVPVLSGVVGGVLMIVGAVGLLALKARQSEASSFAGMTVKDYGLLTALLLLASSGMAVLLTRNTVVFGPLVLIHLAAVLEAIAFAPYSKFVHVVFRLLALMRDNAERGQ